MKTYIFLLNIVTFLYIIILFTNIIAIRLSTKELFDVTLKEVIKSTIKIYLVLVAFISFFCAIYNIALYYNLIQRIVA